MTMSSASSSLKPASAHLPSLLDPAQPLRSLSIGFWLWKALLFAIIIGCPSAGYDTSSSHLPLPDQGNGLVDVIFSGDAKHLSLSIPLKFVRWDSIYFVHIARSGYVFEQEWAFSYAYSKLVNLLASLLFRSDDSSGAAKLAVTAVALSHVAHYLSVLALYRLSAIVFGHDTARKRLVCFLSAALHIISPAGAFLSAPYGESLFSFLNITGFYIYSSSHLDHSTGKHLSGQVKLLLSGCLFAVATSVRSNGILSGVLLAYDALWLSYDVVSRRSFGTAGVRLCFVILSGCIVALGLLIPQLFAYAAYCMDDDISRPWCQSPAPSIYSWVQAHYWGVGFLRYWTVSNLPLFLLASPMLLILFVSCAWALTGAGPLFSLKSAAKADAVSSSTPVSPLLMPLAIAQFLLAAMALTSYHVQIINRISSGYPLWYWYLASQLLETAQDTHTKARFKSRFSTIIQVMVIYGLVQASLFGSFLPPA